jgi:hypothetical protein
MAYGQIWTEVGDAAAGVPGRQDTMGNGALTNINGAINGAAQDWVDTYSIIITDPNNFWATTNATLGNLTGSAGGDSRLWLWDETGRLLLANDDTNNLQSTITAPGNFSAFTGGFTANATAANVVLNPGQKYLLSIAAFPNDALDTNGVVMATFSPFNQLHGQNPASGGFGSWENTGTAAWSYSIELGGATFCSQVVPEPTSLALLGLGSLALCCVRRRQV